MNWLSSFEKVDGCSVIIGDDRLYNMEEIGIVQINMFDVRELRK